MTQHVEVTTADRVTTIRLARPDKRNAITTEMYAALSGALAAASADPSIRAVVLAGGRDCFTAGNDLGDFVRAAQGGSSSTTSGSGGSSSTSGGDSGGGLGFLRGLASFDKPLLAAVSGVAIGIGTTMLLHCDLIYAAPTAKFRTPFVDLALVPEAGSSILLPALIGHRRAAQMLLLGETIEAPAALDWGLINAIVADPDAAAAAAAHKLAALPPGSVRATRALIRRTSQPAVVEAMGIELEAFATRLRSPEAMEAFQAFLGRRAPDFSKF